MLAVAKATTPTGSRQAEARFGPRFRPAPVTSTPDQTRRAAAGSVGSAEGGIQTQPGLPVAAGTPYGAAMLRLSPLVRAALSLALLLLPSVGCSSVGSTAGLPDQWEPDNAGQLTAAEADEEMF